MSNQDKKLSKSSSTARIKFKLRCGNSRLSHTRVSDTNANAREPTLIENRRDAMASDEDIEMVDSDLPRFSTAEKGKGKAAESTLPELDNGLPWCVSSSLYFIDL